MAQPLPPALLSRLSEDAAGVMRSIGESDLSQATASTRDYARRRLLSMTPGALSRLDSLVDSLDDSVALRAATAVLDRSPATAPDSVAVPLATLPPDAVAALSSALASFAHAAATHLASSDAANRATPIIPDSVEVLDVSPR